MDTAPQECSQSAKNRIECPQSTSWLCRHVPRAGQGHGSHSVRRNWPHSLKFLGTMVGGDFSLSACWRSSTSIIVSTYPLPVHFRISYWVDRIPPYTTHTSLWHHGWLVGSQVKAKRGLRRQKVNCGPVIFVILFWPFLVYSCVALYPGLLTPPFVACSTNAGGRPGKIESHAVTYLGVWRSTWYIPGNHK